jgi:SAM-dependent methyltransferase
MAKPKIDSPASLMEMVGAYRKSRIILSAHELDIFTTLGSGSLTAEAVSKKTGTDTRGIDRLMNALVAIGLLNKSNGLFSNTDFSEQFMDRTQPQYIGNLSHQSHLWKTWSTLTDAVRAGSSVTIRKTIGERDNTWLNSFISAMHARKQQALNVAGMVDLSGVKTMLDVGGGSGIFSFAFIEKNKEIKSTVFDLPTVVPITHKFIEEEGYTGKVTTLPGDYLKDDFGGTYDLVLASAIIHINSDEENRFLVKKCVDSLNPGGRLIIMDHIMNEDRTEPEIGAIFAINMLVGTLQGDTYTETELRDWMSDAGLKNIHVQSSHQESTCIIGTK